MQGKDFSEEALLKLNLEDVGMGEQSRYRHRQALEAEGALYARHQNAFRDSRKFGGA